MKRPGRAPATISFSNTDPITVLIHLCDQDPDKESEAMDKMVKFIGNLIQFDEVENAKCVQSVFTLLTTKVEPYNEVMQITQEQYEKIAKYLPTQRGNVNMTNLQLINAIL